MSGGALERADGNSVALFASGAPSFQIGTVKVQQSKLATNEHPGAQRKADTDEKEKKV